MRSKSGWSLYCMRTSPPMLRAFSTRSVPRMGLAFFTISAKCFTYLSYKQLKDVLIKDVMKATFKPNVSKHALPPSGSSNPLISSQPLEVKIEKKNAV